MSGGLNPFMVRGGPSYSYDWTRCRCQTDMGGTCMYGPSPRGCPCEHDADEARHRACPLRFEPCAEHRR